MPSIEAQPVHAVPEPSPARLAMNLAALAFGSPHTAERVSKAIAADEMIFSPTQDPDAPAATADGVALCSRRRPIEEARRFADGVDLKAAGVVVVLGFGLGHHVRALVERLRGRAAVVVFEPDVSMLRSVLERIDCTSWLGRKDVIVMSDPADRAGLSRSMSGLEPMIAMGAEICEHVPSRLRLATTAPDFLRAFSEFVGTVRMHVVTTLVQSDVTVRNLLMNLDHYATRPGIADLAGVAAGRPAVTVSAGPSLRRNLHLLARPGVRDRVVIIAAQTVLKPMLAAGVKPHFVTALDYHEISKRFYEGLTAPDVEGVTLIAEPKVNPAVIEAWPGALRLPADDFLQTLLGDDLAAPRGVIRAGATVAHLSYYLARYLACDPVILIGQDLGFTDGQYYAKGAAIHDVWAGELNAFNTLEMMEWQRIARNRGHLHKAEDQLGREIYTDDQMRTYLAQFERDFMEDRRRGLRIIDATEGGVKKSHADTMTLGAALEEFAPSRAEAVTLPAPAAVLGDDRKARALDRVKQTRRAVLRIAEISRETMKLLARMGQSLEDTPELNRLIERAHKFRDEVKSIEPAWTLLHRVNQAGAFNRLRADRLIAAEDDLTPAQEQSRRIERDKTNVRWIAESADVLGDLLKATTDVFAGGPRRTRDLAPRETESGAVEVGAATVRAAAVIIADHNRSPLGAARDLAAPIRGRSPLTRTLERLDRCTRIERVILFSTHPEQARQHIPPSMRLPVEIRPYDNNRGDARRRSIAAARSWAGACWRGGLGFTTCYDEALDPAAAEQALADAGLDAALVVGADWCLVDPVLCDAALERHAENPEGHAIAFTQAAPGLAGCVLSRRLVGEIAASVRAGALMSHLGGALGYVPRSPRNDPIARSNCVAIDAPLRDAPHRFIPDTPESRRLIEHALGALDGPSCWSAADACDAIRRLDTETAPHTPAEVILEITTRRQGVTSAIAPIDMPTDQAVALTQQLRRDAPGALITLAGRGDPICHPDWEAIVRAAASPEAGLHVRTELRCPRVVAESLARSGAAVISVDLHADDPATYRRLTGIDAFEEVTTNIETLLRAQDRSGGAPIPWVVPRILRRDAVYSEIERFFDRWVHYAGAAVIDQLPFPIPGDRIEPLGKPRAAARRDWRRRVMILADGGVPFDEFDPSSVIGNALAEPLPGVWTRLMRTREEAWRARGIEAPECRTGW